MTNPITEIDLTEVLPKKYISYYLSERYSDITLCVEDQKLPAHRLIMGASSEYFYTRFSTALNEPNQKEFIIKAPLKPFQIILQYFYTGKIKLCNIKNIEIEVVDLIEQYCLFELKPYFENYFIQILSIDNICQLFEIARLYDLQELKIKSFELIDRNAEKILNSESFNKFSKESLEVILKRKSFDAFSQFCIFNAFNEWSKSEDRNIETVLPLLKWHLMSVPEVLTIRNIGNLTEKQVFDAINKNLENEKIDENFASLMYNVRTLHGDMELLNGNCTLYDEKNGYTRHLITDANNPGIIIDLRSIRNINNFKMLLWDRDDRSYSYFIEISTDQKNWKRIIDYSSYSCSSWQNLYFPTERIRFIKLVGTHCSKNKYFDVVTFEAYLRANIPEIKDGFVVPKDNVALLKEGATIIKGIGDGAINGDIGRGSTFHEENGCILIRLNQPYHISSIRLLLDDCCLNGRFKFKIQISLNMKDWETIVYQEKCVASLQKFSFSSKPVNYFKFIGTHNTYNVFEFIVKHFECPAQD